MKSLIKIGILVSITGFSAGLGHGQSPPKTVESLKLSGIERLMSNFVNDMIVIGQDVWIAGGRGLSRTTDLGETWMHVTHDQGLGRGGVSAIAEHEGILWVATAFDTTTELGTFDAGGGLSYTSDRGETWFWIPQPVDSTEEPDYEPTTTNIQNITYDIGITDSAVWIASWGGGLRKSTDMGEHWEVVTVDGLPFHALAHLTHLGFSILAEGDVIWVGTAGGIHKSTDEGRSWVTFNHQNQEAGISGNFVVAIKRQIAGERRLIWAATAEAVDENETRAVSVTEDGGLTWRVTLEGVRAWNFAFDGSVAYVATDQGLYKSLDFGETWAVFPQITDFQTGEAMYTTDIYAVGIGPENSLWVGGADGLGLTLDGGMTWRLFRAFPSPGLDDTPKTFAYPNPFSPMRHNQFEGDGYVRFQYQSRRPTRVTVRVYDFGLNLVCTVVDGRERAAAGEYAEVWNGRNGLGDMVANGVYFYQIVMDGEDVLWGKVMVVN